MDEAKRITKSVTTEMDDGNKGPLDGSEHDRESSYLDNAKVMDRIETLRRDGEIEAIDVALKLYEDELKLYEDESP